MHRIINSVHDQVTHMLNQRLLRESGTWIKLDHPRILPYYGYIKDVGLTVALVSPWMHNGNIQEYMEKAPLLLPARLQLVSQLLLWMMTYYLVNHHPGQRYCCRFGLSTLPADHSWGSSPCTNIPLLSTNIFGSLT